MLLPFIPKPKIELVPLRFLVFDYGPKMVRFEDWLLVRWVFGTSVMLLLLLLLMLLLLMLPAVAAHYPKKTDRVRPSSVLSFYPKKVRFEDWSLDCWVCGVLIMLLLLLVIQKSKIPAIHF